MSATVAVVSGAARGIGAAVCERLAAAGWRTVGLDLDDVADVDLAVTGDVTDEAVWERAVEAARGLGTFAGVVNNAGIQGRASLLRETTLAEHRQVVDVNLTSAFLGTRAALVHLGQGGAVVNIASNAALRGVPRYGAYAAAKHAVLGLTRTAAAEGARHGVRVNAVAPGPTATRIMDAVVRRADEQASAAARQRMEAANPTGRFAEVGEIAAVVTWLLGPEASYVNGSVVSVDGGLTAV